MAGDSGIDLHGTRALVTGGPPIVWLASPQAQDVHDERIVATGFEAWLAGHPRGSA